MFKFLSEFGALIAFFIGYKYGGIKGATLFMLITSVVMIVLSYVIERKFHIFSLVSSGILLLTGGIALISGNSMFIKIKPTILYVISACVLIVSSMRNKPALKYMLHPTFPLKESAWKPLSYRFAGFFVLMAIVNEIVWRNFEEVTWVKFKVFGAIPLTIIFILLQAMFVIKYTKND